MCMPWAYDVCAGYARAREVAHLPLMSMPPCNWYAPLAFGRHGSTCSGHRAQMSEHWLQGQKGQCDH